MTLYQNFTALEAKEAIRRILGLDAEIKQHGPMVGAVAFNDATSRCVTVMAVAGEHIMIRFGPRTMIEGHPSVAIGREVMTLRIEPRRLPGFPIADVAQMVTNYLLGVNS